MDVSQVIGKYGLTAVRSFQCTAWSRLYRQCEKEPWAAVQKLREPVDRGRINWEIYVVLGDDLGGSLREY